MEYSLPHASVSLATPQGIQEIKAGKSDAHPKQ
jgi:hypothetical protein